MKIKLYAAAATLVLFPAPAAAAFADWPQSGYGSGNTFYNPAESRLNAGTVGKVQQRWTLPTHSSPQCEVGIDPVVSGGRLFTSDPGGIGAYDPATGARKWHVDLDRMTVGKLAVADGKLLLLASECDVPAAYESSLIAFEPGTGRRLWTTGLARFTYDLRVDQGMAVLDSNQNGLASTIAYRVADGKFQWLRKGDRGDGLVSAGGRLLLRSDSGGAKAVSVRTGKTLWQTKRNWYAVGADPAGTRFYIDGDPGLSAVDAATGRVIWSTTTHASYVTTDRRHVFFTRYRSTVCLDAATGRKLYSVHLPQSGGRAVRAGGLLYSPNGTAGLMSIADAATGKVLAGGMRSDQSHPPVIAGGWLYVTDGDLLRAYY
jgi:outer membrane protein assembly factor BamB